MSETRELLPKLRFSEFALAGKWLAKPLGKIAIFANEKIPVTTLTKDNYISTENLLTDFGGTSPSAKLPASGVVSGFRPHDILVSNIRPYLKKIWFSDKKGGASNDVMVIRSKDEVSSVYLALLLKRDEFINYMMKDAKGLKMPRGDTDSVKKYPIVFSSSEEQQKIADCLSSLEDLIEAERQRLDGLKLHKKGLMQQLFPRPERTENGLKAPPETTPRLRFPEFQDAPEWELRELNQVSSSIFDGTHQTPTYTSEGIPFLSVENIVSRKSTKFISALDHLNATSKNKPEFGDLIVTRIGNIGFTEVVDWDYEFSIYVTLAVVKKNHCFETRYLHSFMQSEWYQTEIRSKSLLNAVPCKINMDELRKTKVLLPTLKEQQKIAEIFSKMDSLISNQAEIIESLNAHRKGLMQQLFPEVGIDDANL